MNNQNFSILEKLKILIDTVGRLDSKTICLTAEMFIRDITADVFSGNTDKVPDEVWDFMKTLPREIQMFMLSGFAHSIIVSEKNKEAVLKENGGKLPTDVLDKLVDTLLKQRKFDAEKKKSEENPTAEVKQTEPPKPTKTKLHLF